MPGGGAVQSERQLLHDRIVGALVRPILSGGRHLTRAQLPHDAFPGARLARHVLQADAVEVQSALLHFAVVAGDTILVYEKSHWRGRR